MSIMSARRRRWKLPPRIKVLEALSCIADGRISLEDHKARVVGSDGQRTYTVYWDGGAGIYSTDNGSVYRGYLGYPAIAFLMLKGLLPYDERLAEALKGIPWRELNEKYKSYRLTMEHVRRILEERGFKWPYVEAYIEEVIEAIKRLKPYSIEPSQENR